RVVSGAAGEEVVAGPTVEDIVAPAGVDDVVEGKAGEGLAGRAAVDDDRVVGGELTAVERLCLRQGEHDQVVGRVQAVDAVPGQCCERHRGERGELRPRIA